MPNTGPNFFFLNLVELELMTLSMSSKFVSANIADAEAELVAL